MKQVQIFSDLSDEELKWIEEVLHVRELDEGDVLFREGDPGGELFVVEAGSVAILVQLADGSELEIVELSRGNFFGEMSVFEKEPRSATCQAKTQCRLLSLHEQDLHRLIQAVPGRAGKIMRRMLSVTRQRLEDTGEFLSDMVEWGESARKRAITDELTGLHNRRYLDEAFQEQFHRAKESGEPFAVVMVDLDRFREINESYSHETGDRVIVAASEVFRVHLRDGDIAARYGGDEFTFIMPATNAETAMKIGENIRRDVRKLDLLKKYTGPVQGVTTSQGIACFPVHGSDPETLRSAADAALYRAKEQGRDGVVLAG